MSRLENVLTRIKVIIMNTSILNSDERRICERIVLNRNVLVALINGQQLNGITIDISLGGVCIAVQEKLEHNLQQQTAQLFIKDKEGNLSPEFPCTIVRQGGDSLCLKLDRAKSSKFGMMLTKGLFKKKIVSQ